MITEDYVSFETAKLLKERGFDEECSCFYDNIDYGTPGLEVDGRLYYKNSALDDEEYAAPTLQMTMKWLRKVYGLFIRITEDMTGNVFEWSVYQKNYGCKASTYVEESYEQACETAIKYCLKNLI